MGIKELFNELKRMFWAYSQGYHPFADPEDIKTWDSDSRVPPGELRK